MRKLTDFTTATTYPTAAFKRCIHNQEVYQIDANKVLQFCLKAFGAHRRRMPPPDGARPFQLRSETLFGYQ